MYVEKELALDIYSIHSLNLSTYVARHICFNKYFTMYCTIHCGTLPISCLTIYIQDLYKMYKFCDMTSIRTEDP